MGRRRGLSQFSFSDCLGSLVSLRGTRRNLEACECLPRRPWGGGAWSDSALLVLGGSLDRHHKVGGGLSQANPAVCPSDICLDALEW